MWNTSVKIEYIAGLIVDALENYSVNRENAQFRLVIEELRNHFTNCSEQEIYDIIGVRRAHCGVRSGTISIGENTSPIRAPYFRHPPLQFPAG